MLGKNQLLLKNDTKNERRYFEADLNVVTKISSRD